MSINSLNRVSNEVVLPDVSYHWDELSSESLTPLLISRFNQAGIPYCHWKSKSLDGENDVDFLISMRTFPPAIGILMQLGFKEAAPRWGKNLPGEYHYYGYDAVKNELVHLHLFTRVLSGERLIKSHWFPFDEMMLKDVHSINGLVVTSKEAEFVLFIIKTYIRYGSFLDFIRENESDAILQTELQILKASSDMTKVMDYLEKFCPVVEKSLFLDCVTAIEKNASFPRKWLLSQKIRWSLRVYSTSNSMSRWWGYLVYLYAIIRRQLNGQKGKKSLVAGGAIVAIVGADATGKSTLVEKTSSWLRNAFVVKTIHAGKPPSAVLTLPINLLIVINRKLKRNVRRKRIKYNGPASNPLPNFGEDQRQKSLSYAIRAVCLAYDRRNLLLKARRAAANGEIIVSDRYPTYAAGMMDSPRLLENSFKGGVTQLIKNWLTKVERNIYCQIPPPDLVLRLKVSLDIAKTRNANRDMSDDEIYLEYRHQQIEEWFVSGARTIRDINTDNSLDETISIVKRIVWSNL